jgi:hypothetical protein
MCSATSWWCCSTYHCKFFDFFPEKVWPVKETLLVKKLPKKLNWWLSTKLFNWWHIYVINEDKRFQSTFGTHCLFTLLLQLAFNIALSWYTIRLRAKIEGNSDEIHFLSIITYKVLHDHRFTSTRFSSYKYRLAYLCEHHQLLVVSHRVDCGYH